MTSCWSLKLSFVFKYPRDPALDYLADSQLCCSWVGLKKGDGITHLFPHKLGSLLLFPLKSYLYCQLNVFPECFLSRCWASCASFLPSLSCWNPFQHFIFDVSKAHLDTDFSFSLPRLGRQVYQLSQQAVKVLPHISHATSRHRSPQPPFQCMVLLMNLNLLPQQLPSIIPASTANSSPASHFSPLKKSFISLLAVMELPRSLAWEMISQQACGPAAFYRCKVRLHVWFPALLDVCVQISCASRGCVRACEVWRRRDPSQVTASSASTGFLIKKTFIIIPSVYPSKSVRGGWVESFAGT